MDNEQWIITSLKIDRRGFQPLGINYQLSIGKDVDIYSVPE